MSGEPRLLTERRDAAKRRDVALQQRDLARVDLIGERAPAPQAGEFQIEAIGIERPPERHELIFRSATHERRNDVEQSNRRGRRMPFTSRQHAGEIHRSFTWVLGFCASVRLTFLTATASPATQKK